MNRRFSELSLTAVFLLITTISILSTSCGRGGSLISFDNVIGDVNVAVNVDVDASVVIDSDVAVTVTLDGQVIVDLPEAFPPELETAIQERLNGILAQNLPSEEEKAQIQTQIQTMIEDFFRDLAEQAGEEANTDDGSTQKRIQNQAKKMLKAFVGPQKKTYHLPLSEEALNSLKSDSTVASGHNVHININLTHRQKNSTFQKIACSPVGLAIETRFAEGSELQRKYLTAYQEKLKPILCEKSSSPETTHETLEDTLRGNLAILAGVNPNAKRDLNDVATPEGLRTGSPVSSASSWAMSSGWNARSRVSRETSQGMDGSAFSLKHL